MKWKERTGEGRMEKRRERLLAAWLIVCLLLLSGCVDQLSERPLEDLSSREIEAGVSAPLEDSADTRKMQAVLYFLSESGAKLHPVVRTVTMENGVSRAQAAVNALLQGPKEDETGAAWPDIGAARSSRFVEVAGGIATVDLPARARTLPQETLYAVRMAIASTLTEFSEITHVNVLIGGREEGLDLGATLPVGTFARMEDLDAGARYSRLQEQRLSASGVTLLTTLYFPSLDGRMILPQVRSITYSEVSPIEYLYTLLVELGKGAGHALCMEDVPPPMDYIVEMPEIVRTEDGYMAIDLRFSEELAEDIESAGMTLGVYMAMLTDTLMGFVPGVEGLRVSVGDRVVTSLDADETPDGRAITFAQTLAVRDDFSGYVGAPETMYVMGENGNLVKVLRLIEQSAAKDARTRLEAMTRLEDEGLFVLPEGLGEEDILAVHTGAEEIVLNLSRRFADGLTDFSRDEERAAVYAIVNTLTEGTEIRRVIFFFEGQQQEMLAGGLDMRGSFVRNPGMVVN